jgi:hypothetical protein
MTHSPVKTSHQQPKSAKSAARFIRITSFFPLAMVSGPGRILELFHLENKTPAEAEAHADLYLVLSCTELGVMNWRQAIMHGD